VIRELGQHEENTILELRDAGKVVGRILHGVLDQVERHVRASELPAFRTARDLAATMAEEMGLTELVATHGVNRAKLRPGSRALMTAAHHSQRKTTKNTDHQPVPRLEQLADLGFVRKHGPGFDKGDEPRRRWRWAPTQECAFWYRATRDHPFDNSFL